MVTQAHVYCRGIIYVVERRFGRDDDRPVYDRTDDYINEKENSSFVKFVRVCVRAASLATFNHNVLHCFHRRY